MSLYELRADEVDEDWMGVADGLRLIEEILEPIQTADGIFEFISKFRYHGLSREKRESYIFEDIRIRLSQTLRLGGQCGSLLAMNPNFGFG